MIKKIKIKFPDLIKLVSYQDKEVHLGTIYKASNWISASDVPLLDWTTKSRKRTALQSDAGKVRWEYSL